MKDMLSEPAFFFCFAVGMGICLVMHRVFIFAGWH